MVELQLIHGMLHKKWEIRLRHVPKSQNEDANYMSKIITQLTNLQLFVATTQAMKDILP